MCRARERPWSIAGIGMSSVGDRPTALHRFDEMADRQGVESGKQAADLASCSDRRVQRSVPSCVASGRGLIAIDGTYADANTPFLPARRGEFSCPGSATGGQLGCRL